MKLHEMAKVLKAKTDAGAVLMFDRELWEKPKWRINQREISFANSGVRIILWRKAEDDSEAEAIQVIRKRIRVLVDA